MDDKMCTETMEDDGVTYDGYGDNNEENNNNNEEENNNNTNDDDNDYENDDNQNTNQGGSISEVNDDIEYSNNNNGKKSSSSSSSSSSSATGGNSAQPLRSGRPPVGRGSSAPKARKNAVHNRYNTTLRTGFIESELISQGNSMRSRSPSPNVMESNIAQKRRRINEAIDSVDNDNSSNSDSMMHTMMMQNSQNQHAALIRSEEREMQVNIWRREDQAR